MKVYGIDWGNGTRLTVGEDRSYAEQLLSEASGPFSRFNPPPRVVEISNAAGDS